MPFCTECGEGLPEGADTCPSCGAAVKDKSEKTIAVKLVRTIPYKSPGTTALIAFIGAIFFLPGLGHLYIGRVLRGLLILGSGPVLFLFSASVLLGSFGLSIFTDVRTAINQLGIGVAISYSLFLVYVGIWVWQIFNANALAKQYNERILKTNKEPW
jgi:hypothetical protein